MPRRVIGTFVVIVILAATVPAFAQSGRKLGVVMGYPTAAGVLWHVGDRIALRPDFSISRDQVETTTTSVLGATTQTYTSTTNAWSSSLGVSALFYLGQPDDLRFYVSPRAAWLWTRNSVETSRDTIGFLFSDLDTSGYQVSGAVGAQYAPAERFRIFGELGVSYSDHQDEADSGVSLFTTSVTSLGLRSGVGIVVYF